MSQPQDDPEEPRGYKFPTCFLHELNPAFAIPDKTWEEVRIWRKARRPTLIAERMVLSAADRAAACDRTATRLHALRADARGRPIGFCCPFKGEYDPVRSFARC